MLFLAGKSTSAYFWLFALLRLGWSQGIANIPKMEDDNVSMGWPPFLSSIKTPVHIRRSRATPRISKPSCLAPPQPVNGEWKLRQDFCEDTDTDCKIPEGTKLDLGYQLIFICQTGYRVEGDNVVFCRGDRKWSRMPSCMEIKCDTLNSVMRVAECSRFGKRVSCDFPVLPKTQARASCRPGYKEDMSSLTWPRRYGATCNKAGEWEPSPLRCIPVCGQATTRQRPLVIKGSNATIGDFPWHVSLYIKRSEPKGKKEFQCGATLIRTNLLLTAAHCVYDETYKTVKDPSKFVVMTGNIFREYDDPRHDPDTVRTGEVINVHVYYTYQGLPGNYAADIALLELKQAFVASAILLPVCLDVSGYSKRTLEPGIYGRLAGFGRTATSDYSPNLQTITVPYIPYSQCKISKEVAENVVLITKDKFCAGYTNGSAVCEGDSGGGLVFQVNEQWFVMGVASVALDVDFKKGEKTCERYSYTLYTRMSEYEDWILEMISAMEQHKQPSATTTPTPTVTRLTTQSSNTFTETIPTTKPPTNTSITWPGHRSPETPFSCLVPPQPAFGEWKLYRSLCPDDQDCDIPQGSRLQSGSLLVFSCDPGFKIQGSRYVYCGTRRNWTHMPVCIAIHCSALNNPSTIAFCTNRTGDSINCDFTMPTGTRARLTCRPGYKRVWNLRAPTESIVECDSNGKWKPNPIECTQVCGTMITRQTPLAENGTAVPNISDFPWHASIYIETMTENERKKEFICGATMIRDNLLLTAAHCVYDERTGTTVNHRKLFVMMGNIFRDYDSPLHNPLTLRKGAVRRVYSNHRYLGLRGNYDADIALLELQKPFLLSDLILPACLDFEDNSARILEDGAFGRLAAYGKTDSGAIDPILHTITMPYVSYSVCRTYENAAEISPFINSEKFCAGYANGSGLCQNESGGGLMFENNGLWYIMGILSMGLRGNFQSGDGECDRFSYFLYTKVSSYINWIQQVMFYSRNSAPSSVLIAQPESDDTGHTTQHLSNLDSQTSTFRPGPALQDVISASVTNTIHLWAIICNLALFQVVRTVLGFVW